MAHFCWQHLNLSMTCPWKTKKIILEFCYGEVGASEPAYPAIKKTRSYQTVKQNWKLHIESTGIIQISQGLVS